MLRLPSQDDVCRCSTMDRPTALECVIAAGEEYLGFTVSETTSMEIWFVILDE
jgi:hypothetical protein